MSVETVNWSSVRDRLSQYGQEHLLRYLDELSEGERGELYRDISDLDLGYARRKNIRIVYTGLVKFAANKTMYHVNECA